MTASLSSARSSVLSPPRPGTAAEWSPARHPVDPQPAELTDPPVPLRHLVAWMAAGLVGWAGIALGAIWALGSPLI